MAEWAGENVESMKFGWFHGVSVKFYSFPTLLYHKRPFTNYVYERRGVGGQKD